MINENTQNDIIQKRKAQIFFEDKVIVHLKKYDGTFFNGRIFEVSDKFLKIHDRRDGVIKLFFFEVRNLSEYEEEESGDATDGEIENEI
jgi:hypothetical protein|tara:strand:+ start:57 stop:323 length:267 start_codon:yes stop_codon:yes gene_type:complete